MEKRGKKEEIIDIFKGGLSLDLNLKEKESWRDWNIMNKRKF